MAYSHCTGSGQGQGPGNDGFLYAAMYILYTLHSDRDRKPLFSIVSIPVPVPFPVPCSVYEPLDGIPQTTPADRQIDR